MHRIFPVRVQKSVVADAEVSIPAEAIDRLLSLQNDFQGVRSGFAHFIRGRIRQGKRFDRQVDAGAFRYSGRFDCRRNGGGKRL